MYFAVGGGGLDAPREVREQRERNEKIRTSRSIESQGEEGEKASRKEEKHFLKQVHDTVRIRSRV